MVAFDWLRGDAKKLSIGALFVANDMAIGFAEEFVARVAVNAHAELVAHCAGGNEESGFFAEHSGNALFQAANGRIFAEDIVADFRGGHGGAHAGRGASYGIATQVDQRLHLGFSFRGFPARIRTVEALLRFIAGRTIVSVRGTKKTEPRDRIVCPTGGCRLIFNVLMHDEATQKRRLLSCAKACAERQYCERGGAAEDGRGFR